MFILFSAECPKCRRTFKAEAAVPQNNDAAGYICTCPRCQSVVGLDAAAGKSSAIAVGWALKATPIKAAVTEVAPVVAVVEL